MDIIQAAILGIIQGLTEFLPISSSAHLVLAPYFLKWDDPGLAFDVALHLGTLFAILAFFWKDWVKILMQLMGKKEGVPLPLLIIGTIPGGIAGLALEKKAEEYFRSPLLIAAMLAAFALVLYFYDSRGRKNRSIESFGVKDALLVGCAQALAIIPGVSRSGITITTALALGMTRPAAARFSFLLSAPIIAGAGLVKAKHIIAAMAQGGSLALGISAGFMTSLFAGLAALGLLNYMVKNKNFNGFVIYRLLLSLIIVIVVIVR